MPRLLLFSILFLFTQKQYVIFDLLKLWLPCNYHCSTGCVTVQGKVMKKCVNLTLCARVSSNWDNMQSWKCFLYFFAIALQILCLKKTWYYYFSFFFSLVFFLTDTIVRFDASSATELKSWIHKKEVAVWRKCFCDLRIEKKLKLLLKYKKELSIHFYSTSWLLFLICFFCVNSYRVLT